MPVLLTVWLILSLILTGCWNSRELNDLAIVSGIGIDLTANNGEFRVTFQVVNPSASSTSMGSGNGMPAVTVISASDRTVFGALRKASKRATRQLFLPILSSLLWVNRWPEAELKACSIFLNDHMNFA